MNDCYSLVKKFKQEHSLTIAWRLHAHSKVIEKHLNPEEELIYVFCAQKDLGYIDIFNTNIIALTDKRLIIASKRLLFGYYFKSVTPDMYNDLTVNKGIIWGRVIIDTIKEKIFLKYISGDALAEIETAITSYMITEKQKYKERDEAESDK